MEDIIFILLAFAWLMYSLYKGKLKKKKQEKPVPQSSDQPKSEKKDFETIFREMLGEEEATVKDEAETEVVTAEAQTHQMSAEEEQPEEYEQHTGLTGVSDDFEFSAEGKIETIEDQLHKQLKKEGQLEVIELWDQEEEPDSLHFDPYKAIIYAEIINRKY